MELRRLRFAQIHVTILNFGLAGALAIVSAMCMRDIIERAVSNQADAPVAASASRKVHSGVRTRAYYDVIVKRDIFNLVPQQSGPAPVVVEDLHLKLIGTSLLSKSKPYAIIEDPNGSQSLYQVGEDIPDGGRLVGVETNRAIIDRGGHRVAIDIPASEIPEAARSRLGGVVGAPPRRTHAAMRRRMRGGGRAPAREDEDNSSDGDSKLELKKLGPGKFEARRAEIAQTMQNPAAFLSQMRALPPFVNGKTDGFSISQVAPGSVFDQLGLQNGDLLTEIDGQPVTNPMQATGLMQSIRTPSAIDLTISRAGAPTKVHLDLR